MLGRKDMWSHSKCLQEPFITTFPPPWHLELSPCSASRNPPGALSLPQRGFNLIPTSEYVHSLRAHGSINAAMTCSIESVQLCSCTPSPGGAVSLVGKQMSNYTGECRGRGHTGQENKNGMSHHSLCVFVALGRTPCME